MLEHLSRNYPADAWGNKIVVMLRQQRGNSVYLYLRLIRSLDLHDGVTRMAVEELRNCLNSIVEVRSINSITEHPKGSFAVALQIEEDFVGAICDHLESTGYRGVL